MKLADDAFTSVEQALLDAFRDIGDFELISRCLNTRLQDITRDGRLPLIVLRVIEHAEHRDQVDRLVRCARQQNPHNRRLAALDAGGLGEAPSTDQVVDAGGGASTFKQSLKEALADLDTPGLQLVAAADLTGLLESATDSEAVTLYLALLGNLKTDRPDEVLTALVPVVAAAMRRLTGDGRRPRGVTMNLARTRLRRIDLSGLDLHEFDIAFADLRHADLDHANLWRTRGYGVDVSKAGLRGANLEEARWHSAVAKEARFHDSRMIAVVLKEADLAGAEFHQSRLQGAHFDGADLTGARFEQANLADAFFRGATIDDAAATSLSHALKWQSAHFDNKTRDLIAKNASI